MRGSPCPPLRILIVDDNEETAVSLAYLFRSWEHDVRVVHDGPSGVEAAQTFRPNVILLDISLPGFDGFEVARQLRLLPDFRRVLIVGSSGYSGQQDRRRAREVGIDAYLVKPFDPWQLKKVFAAHRTNEAVASEIQLRTIR
jgi:CheY-like chemotaxis protein